MPFGKGQRRLYRALGWIILGAALVWFSLPLWLPWVLRPLGARVGVRFSAYQRLGYSRFALEALSLTNRSLVFHTRRLEAFVPSAWLWKLAVQERPARPFVSLTDWSYQLLPSADTNRRPAVVEIDELAATLRGLQKWVPTAVLTNGLVQSGQTALSVPNATWSQGRLITTLQLPAQASGRRVEATLSPARPFRFEARCPQFQLSSSLEIATNRSGLEVSGSVDWQTNRLDLQAHFAPTDQWPATATLRSPHFAIPAATLHVPRYADLTGSLSAQWEHARFQLDLNAAAHPLAGQTNLPPIDLALRATGDTRSASIQQLVLQAPFVEAQLQEPLRLSFKAPFLETPGTLALAANLSRQQWFALTGTVTGSAKVTLAKDNIPEAQLQIRGTNVTYDSIKAVTLELRARCHWPELELLNTDVRFQDNSTATLQGNLDLQRKSVTAGQLRFAGPLARRWLPAGCSYGGLEVSANFHGSLEKLAHDGRFEADQVTTPLLQPLKVQAQWSGEAETLRNFSAQLSSTNTSVALRGALALDPTRTDLRLTSLLLQTNQATALELANPVELRLAPASKGAGWQLDTTPLQWEGPGGQVNAQASIQWPSRGALKLSVQRLPLGLFQGLSETNLPRLTIDRLNAQAGWTNGPARLNVALSASGFVGPSGANQATSTKKTPTPASAGAGKPARPPVSPAQSLLSAPLRVELALSGTTHGLVLSNLAINSATSLVMLAQGELPLSLTPASPSNWFTIEPQQPLAVRASLRPEAFFWQDLARWTGLRLQDPNVDLGVSGTWAAPQGQLSFRARSLQLPQAKLKQLSLQDLRFALEVDRQSARVTEGQVLIQGQRLSLNGQCPLGPGAWKTLERGKLPDWRRATARLQIAQAQLSAFEPLFPELLAPQGELSLDLTVLPGAHLQGALEVRNARTRPLGNTAPLRDINVTVRFRDRLLSLENASASLSGAQIDLAGNVDLRGTNWWAGGLPPFAFTLRGTNVPLAREPDYIIRSDLDLALAKTNDAPPVVSGFAHLRDSFFLSDLSALVPGRVAKPSARPPYFSIDTPLLADWRLAVTVDGVRWLKVRTSLFNGEVTANLHLQGTLKDPIALGGLKIDSGVVRFPFGSLQVQQGLVTLSSQDPYHPQLSLRANSKQFGYDIRMEVSGAADAPVIQFTSNPPLSSEQILLMVTAGQLPQGTYTLTPQQRAETMALFLGRDFLAKLGLADQTQERLTIRSGEEISEQGRPTYHVEYKFARHWFLVGEYDRFGDYNAGFKWRVYSR